MAFLNDFDFTGGIGDLSFYRMRGSKKTVVRRKGGAKRDTILNSPQFALPRKYMSEFGACSTMGKTVRRMMGGQRNLADYNFSGSINALLKVVQTQDTKSVLGKRNIELSKCTSLLEGFSLNQEIGFDSIVRNTLGWSLDRETRSAHIDIPNLIPGVNFFTQNRHPMFSIVVSLGMVPDFFYNEQLGIFEPPKGYQSGWAATEIYTPWTPVLKGTEAFTVEIATNDVMVPPDNAHSLILTIGIRFGTVYGGGAVERIEKIGASKVLAVR